MRGVSTFHQTIIVPVIMAEKQEIPVIEVRVLDPCKKSKFIARRASNFPIVTSLDEFRVNIIRFFPDLGSVSMPNFQFGYVAERNKKFSIRSTEELEKGFDNAVGGYPFWIDPYAEDVNKAVGKRKFIKPCMYYTRVLQSTIHFFSTYVDIVVYYIVKSSSTCTTQRKCTSMTATAAAGKYERHAVNVEEIMTELQEKHGANSYPIYKYRIWAEMVVRMYLK